MKTITKHSVTRLANKTGMTRMEALLKILSRLDLSEVDTASLPVWGKCPVSDTTDVWSWDTTRGAGRSEKITNNLSEIETF